MKTYQDMNNEEIKEQLEWSDQYEFSYGYSMWAFKEIERLNKIIETKNKRIKKLEDNNKDLKAILKEYKYELGLQELENTSIVDLD